MWYLFIPTAVCVNLYMFSWSKNTEFLWGKIWIHLIWGEGHFIQCKNDHSVSLDSELLYTLRNFDRMVQGVLITSLPSLGYVQ